MKRSRCYRSPNDPATGNVTAAFAFTLLFLTVGIRPASAVEPEYLAAELPIPSTLRDTRSATDNVGLPLEDRAVSELLRPSDSLPWLRRKIPDTGISLFDDAVYIVAPRFYYRLRDHGSGTKSEAFAGGGAIRFESGWLWDTIRFGLAGYSSLKLHGPDDRDGTGLLQPGQQLLLINANSTSPSTTNP